MDDDDYYYEDEDERSFTLEIFMFLSEDDGNILLHFAAICLTGAKTNSGIPVEGRRQFFAVVVKLRRKIARFPTSTSTTLTFDLGDLVSSFLLCH